MNKIITQNYQTPFGELILGSFHDRLCLCDWRYRKMRPAIDKRILKALDATYVEGDNVILQDARSQLGEYFGSNRTVFDIPLKMIGSPFQVSVWKELLTIPFGETTTYLALSKKLKGEKSVRAVAGANGANAISIIIPCHRVTGSNGRLVGYAGGLEVKRKLLQMEGYTRMPGQMQLFN